MRAQRFSFGRVADVDLRLLRTFAAVVEAGGFVEAQTELGTALSTISTAMADLEERLGVRLCFRGRGGFRLTDEGRLVYEEALGVFAALDRFRAAAKGLSGKLVGELKIGLIDNSVFDPATRIPGAILAFTDRHPDVHINVEVLSPDEIESLLLTGELDVGIGVFGRRKPGLVYADSFSEVLDLYCGRDHPLFARAPNRISESDLDEARYARGVYSPPPREGDKGPFDTADATAHQAEGLAFLILSGRFVGHLPRRYAAIWVKAGLMRALRPKIYSQHTQFQLVTRKGIASTSVLRAFLEVVQGRVVAAPGRGNRRG